MFVSLLPKILLTKYKTTKSDMDFELIFTILALMYLSKKKKKWYQCSIYIVLVGLPLASSWSVHSGYSRQIMMNF